MTQHTRVARETRITRVRYNEQDGQLYPIDPHRPLTGQSETGLSGAGQGQHTRFTNTMQDLAAPQTMPQSVQTSLNSNYSDRAVGFRLAWAPMAWITGLLVAVIGAVGYSVPVVSLMTLLPFGTGFAVVWLVGWLITVAISPDGIALLHAINQWRLIHREHKARLGGLR